MRQRVIVLALLLVAVPAAVIFGLGAGGDSGTDYKVRAIFDNASFLIPGEDVKVAGAKAGVVDSLDVTPDHKAAIVIKITRSGFKDFRADARCSIRLQSVIGEKLIECTPSQPREDGAAAPPPLKKIPKGQEGAGQYLLPVQNTSTPVDADLINNIQRRPFRERLSILLNELGTGLAARGGDLREVIHRANPGLQQFDRFLKILADQNTTLRDLAHDSDVALSALARKRQNVADFFVQSGIAGQATAEHKKDLERNFQKFPAFLRELRPFMNRYAQLSNEMAPVVSDLRAAGPDISRFMIALGPFSKSTTPALKSLGNAADIGRPALEAAKPIAQELDAFASKAKPVASNLAKLATSLQQHGAIERAMDLFMNLALSTNGYDEIGHYLRNALIVTACSSYATTPGIGIGCSANFIGGGSDASGASARASAASKPSEWVARFLVQALGGGQSKAAAQTSGSQSGDSVGASGGTSSDGTGGSGTVGSGSTPARTKTPPANSLPARPPASKPERVQTGSGSGGDPLLDYLLGSAK